MFEMLLTESTPSPALRLQATRTLSCILERHIDLLLPGISTQRDYIRAKARENGARAGRMWNVDLQRAETLLRSLLVLRADPEAAASVRLNSLLRLLGGPLRALEMSPHRLGAQVAPEMARGRSVRILLEPEKLRRRRVQIEELDPERPGIVRSRGPRCYGEVGQSYISWALNRLDLASLIMATVAYLRDN